MGLMEWLCFRGWPRPEGDPEYDLDLVTPALGEIALRRRSLWLRERLGPPDSWSRFRQGHWWYGRWGLSFEVEHDAIASFGASVAMPPWHGSGTGDFRPACRRIRTSGGVSSPADFTLARALAELGPPDERDDDEEETILTYLRLGWGMDVEFRPDGTLQHVQVFADEGADPAPA